VSRRLKILLIGLLVLLAGGLIYLRSLHRRVLRLAQSQASEEQARREVVAPPISTPTDVRVKAKIFWASPDSPDQLQPFEIELPLSADPVQRSRQLLRALVTNPPSPAQRTLPAALELLDFYLLPDGTAIADFSDILAANTPSGILSEQLAVDSIARTLENNVAGLRRLKILIHGQEADTLAGHVDLTGFFDLNPVASAPTAVGSSESPASAPQPRSGLTASTPPGKLKP
jgi:hypothetical protein